MNHEGMPTPRPEELVNKHKQTIGTEDEQISLEEVREYKEELLDELYDAASADYRVKLHSEIDKALEAKDLVKVSELFERLNTHLYGRVEKEIFPDHLPKAIVMSHEKGGDPHYATRFTYDNKGNVISEVTEHKQQGTYSHKYTYDNNGNVTSEVYQKGDSGYSVEYTYDKFGNMTKSASKSTDRDEIIRSFEYTYDEAGKVAKRLETSPPNYITLYEYSYDANGNVLEEKNTDPNSPYGTMVMTKFAYDDDNRIISKDKKLTMRQGENANMKSWAETCTYNNDGTIATKEVVEREEDTGYRKHFVSGRTESIVYAYDGSGNVIRETHEHSNGKRIYKSTERTFTYDDKGNLMGEEMTSDNEGRAYYDYEY